MDAWRSTYRGQLSADFLAALSVEEHERRWQRTLSEGDVTLVAGDPVAGFALGGAAASDDPLRGAELQAIYLRDEAQRRGAGRALVLELATRLERAGYGALTVWVLASNVAARRFYERLGAVELLRRERVVDGAPRVKVLYGWPDLRDVVGWCAVRELWARIEARDWEGARLLLHDDVVVEWPHSREQIRGAEAFVAVQRAYPEGWSIRVRHVLARGARVVSEVEVHHPPHVFHAASSFEVREGRIARGRELWVQEGSEEPPAWRAALTGRA